MFDNDQIRAKCKERTFIHNTEETIATLPLLTHRQADAGAPPAEGEEVVQQAGR